MSKNNSNHSNSFKLFWNAVKGSWPDIWVSLQVIVAITLVLAIIFYIAECTAQPEEYGSVKGFFQSIAWALLRYIGDPGKFAQVGPVTVVGRIVAMLIGILGILIFAIPAGVIGARFRNAIDSDKRNDKLNDFRKRMTKSFRRVANKSLRTYLDSLPDKGGKKFSKLNFVPLHRTISRMQVRQGMDIKDVMDVCAKFDEFRLKNLAQALPDDESSADRFVVEHFPINRKYGYFINRGSKVTIFSTSSATELGSGWFSYYLAKFGGFNYLSKDLNADPDELDSFFNMSDYPLCDKKTLDEWNKETEKEKKTPEIGDGFNVLTSKKDALKLLKKKQEARDEFFNDLRAVLVDEDSWLIEFNGIDAIKENHFQIVFSDANKDQSKSGVINQEKYQELFNTLSQLVEKELELKSEMRPARYPLNKKNLAFFLRKEIDGNRVINNEFNAFALRVSFKFINLDSRKLILAYLASRVISEKLDDNRGMQDYDQKDFETTGFGYHLFGDQK